jgi:hypothetical protein
MIAQVIGTCQVNVCSLLALTQRYWMVQCNKIRIIQQHHRMVVTHSDCAELFLWDFDKQPDWSASKVSSPKSIGGVPIRSFNFGCSQGRCLVIMHLSSSCRYQVSMLMSSPGNTRCQWFKRET